MRGGDVYLFVAGLVVVQALHEVDPKAVSGAALRKAVSWVDGQGWVDQTAVRADAERDAKAGSGEAERKLSDREIKQEGLPLDEAGEDPLPIVEKK